MSDCCPIEVIELQPVQTIEIDIETAQQIQVIEIGEAGPAGPTIWSAIAEKPDVFPPAPHDHAGQYDPAGAAETARQQAIAAAADDATAKADAAQQAAAADATAKANAAQTAAAWDATQKIDALKDGVNADGDTLAKLRALIANLQTLLTSDNVNLDTLQEVVDFVETHQSSLESLGASKVNVSDIIDVLTDTSSNKPLAAAQGKVLKDLLDALTIVVNGKQPLIVAGSTGQYWRGDKTWRDFAADVRAAALTGLSTATNAVILATDSVLTAFGKLQAQIAAVAANAIAHISRTDNPHGVTAVQAGADPSGTASSVISAHVAEVDPHDQYALESALGNAAGKDVGTTAGTVCAGDDSRLSDDREWTAATVDQAEAEAGTATTRRAWTAQRVKQAIAAWWLSASSAFGRTLANVADAAAGRTALGLGNVDNTSDANKPVSTAQQAALNLKLNSAEVSPLPFPAAIPRAGIDGKIDPSWIRQAANDIGTPGLKGFGVGICPAPPAGMSRLVGTLDVASDNYGNYQYSDGSIMCWIPAFFYKWGTGANGLPINGVSIKPLHAFASVADANAAGYALHRAFYDGGAEQPGFFVDKYQWSNNGGVASSIALGNPISSAADHNPFSGLNGAPTNAYHGAIVAAKTRGADFFCSSRFIFSALALLSYAHAAAAKSTNHCAWFDAVANFPKGNNNNALRDANDTSVLYTSTGRATHPNCGKTGSGSPFAKTTHNGQACGVADLNGNMWEITPGITSDGANFYVLKPSVAMKGVTSGTTLATDLWGATGIAAMYDSLGATFESLTASSTAKLFGSASQVFSEAVAGNEWTATGAGIPLAGGTGGSNAFGNDWLWDYRPNQLCPISGGSWGSSASAGVWALLLSHTRTTSYSSVGGRSALYL